MKTYTQEELDAAIEVAIKDANDAARGCEDDYDELVERCQDAKADVADKAEEMILLVQEGHAHDSFLFKDAVRELREALDELGKVLH